MKILGDRLLLSPLPDREVSAGGIILPMAQTGDVRNYWKVDSVGTGRRNKRGEVIPLDFAPGDIVVTALYMDHTTIEDGSNRKIVGTDQIIAKLDPVPEVPPATAA